MEVNSKVLILVALLTIVVAADPVVALEAGPDQCGAPGCFPWWAA